MLLHSLDNKLLVGWNEWCSLPKLRIPAIKAKIDTGAKTSAIHAFNIRTQHHNGKHYVYFDLHPLQKNSRIAVPCRALIMDQRAVMSSNGHIEHRYVILTPLHLGNQQWDIELTLSNRDPLQFRMLLGRAAIQDNVLINPARTQCQGKLKRKQLRTLYSSSSAT